MKKSSVRWFLLFILTLAVIVSTEIIQHNWRMENSSTVTAECEVIEKYTQSSGPRNATLKYYLVLSFSEDQTKHETTISTTRQGYEDVTIGESALCEVTYDKKGILDILVVDDSVDHYTRDEQGQDLIRAFCVVGGILVLMVGLSFFLPGNDFCSDGKPRED